MKINKTLIIATSILSFALVAVSIPTSTIFNKAKSINSPQSFSTDITPTKPGKGETVSFLPEAVSSFWQMEDLLNNYPSMASEIGELTQYNDDLTSWIQHLGNNETDKNYRRNIFNKYDIFRPTNNVLAWNSSIDAKNYKVIISQDKSFTTIEREYEVSGTENSVIFTNPYSNTDYYWQVIATKNDDSLIYSDIFNFKTASLPRTVLIEGVSNTRDLGGNIGLDNKRMKEGLIYRGMGLEAITTNGENEFKNELGIKTELDLRGIGEGIENYLSLPNYYHYSAPLDYFNNSGNVSGIEWTGEGSLVPNFGNAIKVLANKDNYPVYFHCAVGRDRTGWMGICLNLLCGVSEEVTLKEFILSLFSTSGAYAKGTQDFYKRYIRIRDYINTFEGDNLSEKMANYLITKAGVTSEEINNVRKILLGDLDTGFIPGKDNPNSYSNLAKVTFRRFGMTPIIQMVEVGSLLDEPNIAGNGKWYLGDELWDFEHDVVTEDIYLDYISKDKCKVAIHYSGIDLPDDVIDVLYHTEFDFSIFDRDGYTFKVYDDSFNQLLSLEVVDDISLNVVYSPISGYIPKANSRIIVMAGQSNGAGVGHYNYLENSLDASKLAEINNGYDNVLITGYSHGDHFTDGWRKVYANNKSRTAGTPGTFGFEVGLADRLSKAFPDETTYILKYAHGGASLNYDYISPSGIKQVDVMVPELPDVTEERGWLYRGLESSLTEAIKNISETTNTIPMIEAFMWMQGESDAELESSLDVYIKTFELLLDDFTTTFKDNLSYKFAVYDAGICETSVWDYAKEMNALKRARCDDKNIYIDTVSRLTTSFEPIGSSTDNAHYDAACYIDLGHMFADAYLSKTVRGYKHNYIEIEAIEKLTLKMGEDYVMDDPIIYFNDEAINEAKISYFAEQHHGVGGNVISYFKVNNDNSFSPTRKGKTHLRITAYYNNEVRTVIIPVEVVS